MPSPFLWVEITKHRCSPVWLRTSTFYCNIVNISAANATGFIAPRSGRKAAQAPEVRLLWQLQNLARRILHPCLGMPILGAAPQRHKGWIFGVRAPGGLSRSSRKHPWSGIKSQSSCKSVPSLVLSRGISAGSGLQPSFIGITPSKIRLGTASRSGHLPRLCLFGNSDGEESQWPWERLFQCCTWARLRAAPLWLTQSVSSPCFTQIPPFQPVKWVQPPGQKGGTFQLSGLPWSVYQI